MESYLGSLLKIYQRANRFELQEIAARIGRHPSQLSRIIKGDRCHLDHAELNALAAAVAPEDRDAQVNLMVAYLLDLLPEQFRNEVLITNGRAAFSNEQQPLEPQSRAAVPV